GHPNLQGPRGQPPPLAATYSGDDLGHHEALRDLFADEAGRAAKNIRRGPSTPENTVFLESLRTVDQHSSVNPGEDDLTTISDPQVVIRHNVRANVPYLRRFGRAITGSQTRADICVVQLMEDLLVDPGLIEDGVTPKAALYRRFLDIMHSVPGGGGSSDVPTPLERQAYLLTTVEGFDFAQASNVLNVSVAELSRMIEDVQAQLSSQAGARTLIIEDEPLIAAHLKLQVKQL